MLFKGSSQTMRLSLSTCLRLPNRINYSDPPRILPVTFSNGKSKPVEYSVNEVSTV
jgi:hypothetical protein